LLGRALRLEKAAASREGRRRRRDRKGKGGRAAAQFDGKRSSNLTIGETDMHHSRLCAVLVDCKVADLDEAARFWAEALGRPVDRSHPMSRGNYRMLETPPDEPIVEIQRVEHESRVHIDIETDDIPAEVARLEKLGAKVANRLQRWVVMEAPTGQRFCVVRVQRPGFAKNANRWD
jgi:predicted enzyme related to lactoylglutathione lyase